MHFPTYFLPFIKNIRWTHRRFPSYTNEKTILKSVISLQKYDLQKDKTNKIQLFLLKNCKLLSLCKFSVNFTDKSFTVAHGLVNNYIVHEI